MIPVYAKPAAVLMLIFGAMLPFLGCDSGTDSASLPAPDDFSPSDSDTDTDIADDSDAGPGTSPEDDLEIAFITEVEGLGGAPTDVESGDTEVDEDAQCDTETPVELNLLAKDANAMAGPVLARAIINEGGRVTKAIRTYEFLNYYRFDSLLADTNRVNVSAALSLEELAEETATPHFRLQIGVSAPAVTAPSRRPLSLTLSIDTSESMAGHAFDMVKASCLAIAGSLQNGDIVSVVTWATELSVLIDSHIVEKPNDTRLLTACEALSISDVTDPHAGLVKTYALARGNFNMGFTNRVILMSDGGAKLGVTDEELVASEADDTNGEGIYLMGVGMADTGTAFNDLLLDTLTNAGKGANIYIDTEEEVAKMFGERFIANLTIAARDVSVMLSLPPSFEVIDMKNAPSDRSPEEATPQYLAPGDTMIFLQEIAFCDAGDFADDSIFSVSAIYKDPFTFEESQERFETTLGLLLDADDALLRKGIAITSYAEALKSLKTLEEDDAQRLIDETLVTVNAAASGLSEDPDLLEIATLLSTYRKSFPIIVL